MLTITTWQTFLTYGLDLVTKDELAASIYIIACDQVKFDAGSYDTKASPIVRAKTLWPEKVDMDTFLKEPHKYIEFLEKLSSTPQASIGRILELTTCIPCFMFVGKFERNDIIVHALQKFFFDTFGVGSLWLDGMIYDGNANEYLQDDEKVKREFKELVKHRNQQNFDTKAPPGRIHREARLNTLNSMSETDMREYLKKRYKTDTSGMDSTKVYGMMVDLFVDESDGVGRDQVTKAIRYNYKHRKKKK